jgi:putative toxin-antitoxin system antitoxin component (TIGR02293 family)
MSTTTVRHKTPRSKSRTGHRANQGLGLGLETDDPIRLVRQVRAGFPYSRLARFQKATSMPWDKVAHLMQIPLRTITRRQSQGRLRADESDRLLRAVRLFEKAVDLFDGDVGAARRWLQAPQRGLGGEVPLEFASTEVVARQVENLIVRLEHGVFT